VLQYLEHFNLFRKSMPQQQLQWFTWLLRQYAASVFIFSSPSLSIPSKGGSAYLCTGSFSEKSIFVCVSYASFLFVLIIHLMMKPN
jgi:hypothetical protein